MGRWCYSREWVWNSRTTLCCIASGKWNVSKVSSQKFDIRCMFSVIYFYLLRVPIQWSGIVSQEGKIWICFSFLLIWTFCEKPMERSRRPNFVVFVVWSALIVGRWVVKVWGRRSCLGPAENASFVFLALFRHIVLGRSRSIRGASHQPAFIGSCLTINHMLHVIPVRIIVPC